MPVTDPSAYEFVIVPYHCNPANPPVLSLPPVTLLIAYEVVMFPNDRPAKPPTSYVPVTDPSA